MFHPLAKADTIETMKIVGGIIHLETGIEARIGQNPPLVEITIGVDMIRPQEGIAILGCDLAPGLLVRGRGTARTETADDVILPTSASF
jgi:hypothetical protein